MEALTSGVTGPFWDNLAMAASAGEPGIILGSMKLTVMAAQRVTKNRPIFPKKYRT